MAAHNLRLQDVDEFTSDWLHQKRDEEAAGEDVRPVLVVDRLKLDVARIKVSMLGLQSLNS